MRFSLSIVLDKNGYNRQDLYQTNTLKEMDDYLLGFKDYLEIREKYCDSVQEFLLENMAYIRESERKNNRLNNGRICIVYIGRNNQIRMFPIIYRDSPKLLRSDSCLRKIHRQLDNDDKLRELLNTKRYLLSQYEIDLLSDYLMHPVSYKRYKHIMINDFIARLNNLSDDKLYMYLRSLMNLCDLSNNKQVIVTKHGNICLNEDNILTHGVLKRDMIRNGCDDVLFLNLFQEKNYDELYRLYDIDEMDRRLILEKSKIKERGN